MKKGKAELRKNRGYYTRVANPKISLAGMQFGDRDWHYFDKNGDELQDGDKINVYFKSFCPAHLDGFIGIFHTHERFYHAYIIWGYHNRTFKCPPDIRLENVIKIKDE